MRTSRILTPTLLDAPVPGLEAVAERGGWTVNAPPLPSGDQLVTRTGAVLTALGGTGRGRGEGRRAAGALGGDCCQPIAVMAGLARAGIRPMLLWLDAHGDFNTHETTISGFVGGMPLAMLTGRGRPDLLRAVELEPMPDRDVVLSDARNLDPREAELLAASAVTRVASIDEAIAIAAARSAGLRPRRRGRRERRRAAADALPRTGRSVGRRRLAGAGAPAGHARRRRGVDDGVVAGAGRRRPRGRLLSGIARYADGAASGAVSVVDAVSGRAAARSYFEAVENRTITLPT